MNLLIVDDEHHIVNYLAMLVEDNIHEDLEVYRAYSGSQALAILSETMIDLIFLDIQMPGMSGLELASKITGTWPHCRLIFLTAYDTFDYIYQTRNFPSSQYLLKTESDQTILATLTETMDSILKERSQQTALNTVNRKNRYLSHLLSQRLLRMLLADTPLEILQAEYEFVHADFPFRPNAPFFLLYMNIRHRNLAESRSPSPERVLEYLQMMDYQLAGRFAFSALHLDNGDFLWFFQTLSDADFGLSRPEIYLKNITADFAAEFNRVFHRETFFLLHPAEVEVPQLSHVLLHFQSQLDLAAFSAADSSPVILCPLPAKAPSIGAPEENHADAESLFNELSYAFSHGKTQEYMNLLSTLRNICKKKRSMHNLFNIRIYNSISLMLITYIDTYHLQESLASCTAIYPLYYIHDFPTWDAAFHYLATLSQSLFEIMLGKRNNRNLEIIEKIQAYIHENLDQPLTLSAVASVINYNEAYISRFFKKHTQMKFSDYILRERLTKAKQLLTDSNLPVQQIASETGFDSIHYFSFVFKKEVGISPTEYRRNVRL